jgi:DNA-binding MarR family transcriptional regulator
MRTLRSVASSRDRRPSVDLEPLMVTSRVMNAVIVTSMASVDAQLTGPQLRVLVILAAHDGASLSTVADDLGVNPSNASRTVEQLVQRGLVRRGADPADRRRVVLRLARPGTRLLDRVMDRRRQLLEEVVDRMRPEDRESLMAAAELFNAAAHQLGVTSERHVASTPALAPWLG